MSEPRYIVDNGGILQNYDGEKYIPDTDILMKPRASISGFNTVTELGRIYHIPTKKDIEIKDCKGNVLFIVDVLRLDLHYIAVITDNNEGFILDPYYECKTNSINNVKKFLGSVPVNIFTEQWSLEIRYINTDNNLKGINFRRNNKEFIITEHTYDIPQSNCFATLDNMVFTSNSIHFTDNKQIIQFRFTARKINTTSPYSFTDDKLVFMIDSNGKLHYCFTDNTVVRVAFLSDIISPYCNPWEDFIITRCGYIGVRDSKGFCFLINMKFELEPLNIPQEFYYYFHTKNPKSRLN